MERASGGYLQFELVEWRNLNEIYAQADGHRYTVAEYVKNRRSGNGWHEQGGGADYPRILREQNVAPLVDEGRVDEVWIFSDHYFGLWEASMAGPRSFNINGGVYPQVASQRPFALYGFNYERAVAEMAHNTAHRTEATMNRVYGGWNLKAPTTVWDRFSANHDQSDGLAGVGTCHWPPNAKSDYDYGNPREVLSWADDFLNYPNLTGMRKPVSRHTWFDGDNHRGYLRWYFAHLPRASGTSADGRQHNWWKYLYDFDNYTERGQAKPAAARLLPADLFALEADSHHVKLACQSPIPIDPATFGDDDLVVVAPQGERLPVHFVAVNDVRPGTYRVAMYEIDRPNHNEAWPLGAYQVHLQHDAIDDVLGNAVAAGSVGSFVARTTTTSPRKADDATLLLVDWDKSPQDPPLSGKQTAVESVDTPWGRGARYTVGSQCTLAATGHLDSQQGTIEFWIKPDWQGDDGKTRVLLEAGRAFNNGLLMQIDGANNLRLMLWGDDPTTSASETNVERGVATNTSQWTSGQWQHVAATWNGQRREMALYVDGKLFDSRNDGVRLASFSQPEFKIGSRAGGDSCRATLDNLHISGRARTASEISAAYEATLGLEKLRLEPATLALDPAQRRTLRVVAPSQAAARDVTALVRWSIDDPAVARVDRHGTITALAAGQARVTATLGTLQTSLELVVADIELPTAKLTRDFHVPADRNEPLSIEIDFSPGIETASLDGKDLRVVGPKGFQQFATLEGHETSPQAVRATYRIQPPPQGWSALHAGRYALELKGWQVHRAGRFVAEGRLATFDALRAASHQ
jgi:hypothetical protein